MNYYGFFLPFRLCGLYAFPLFKPILKGLDFLELELESLGGSLAKLHSELLSVCGSKLANMGSIVWTLFLRLVSLRFLRSAIRLSGYCLTTYGSGVGIIWNLKVANES
jgi:hypothetical protein